MYSYVDTSYKNLGLWLRGVARKSKFLFSPKTMRDTKRHSKDEKVVFFIVSSDEKIKFRGKQ